MNATTPVPPHVSTPSRARRRPLALITGAGGGIGAEVARRLRSQGFRLILVDINEPTTRSLAAELGEAEVITADLADRAAVADLAGRIADSADALDVAFINAGVVAPGSLVDTTDRAIDLQIDVNLHSAIHIIRACARNMIRQGRGHIIATVSMGGILALKDSATYSASKFGLRGLLAGLRDELLPHGIKVGGIYPSGVDTTMLQMEAREGGSPLNFVSTPQSIAAVGDAFVKALRTGRLEVYVPYLDSVLSRLLSLAPGLMTNLYPLLMWLGERGRRRYLASIRA